MLTAPLQEGYPPSNEATCWPWVPICKVLGWDPGGLTVNDPATVVNGLQHTTLAFTWSEGQSDWA